MKYYSEKLDKIFDKVEDLKAAEAVLDERERAEAEYQKKLDTLYEEIIKKCEEYIKIYEDYVSIKDKGRDTSAVNFTELVKTLFE